MEFGNLQQISESKVAAGIRHTDARSGCSGKFDASQRDTADFVNLISTVGRCCARSALPQRRIEYTAARKGASPEHNASSITAHEPMKAVQVVSRGEARFVEVPTPTVEPGQLLVRASHLSLCGSDIHMLHYAADAEYPFPPGTTGHEMVGIVEAVGEGAAQVKVGDRVLAMSPDHRAMSEYHLTPVEHIVPLPADLPLDHLLQAQQLGTVLYACQRLSNLIGKDVVVIGQGSAGLWFNFQLRRLGARRVIALDIEEFRLALSRQYGATQTVHNEAVDPCEAIRSITGGELADVVVEAAGETAAINLAPQLVKHSGEILFFGVPREQNITFDFDCFFRKCCRTNSIVGAAMEKDQISTQIAVDLIVDGIADPAPLITHRFPFAEVLNAYDVHHRRSDGAVKVVIDMPPQREN